MSHWTRCSYCGADWGEHQPWCAYEMAQVDLREAQKKAALGRSSPHEASKDAAARLVPSKELVPDGKPVLPPQEHPSEGRGLERPQAEVEAERNKRSKFVVIQGYSRTESLHAVAKLLEVREEPGGRLFIVNFWELTQISPARLRQEVTYPLSGVADGIMVGAEINAFKLPDELNRRLAGPPDAAREEVGKDSNFGIYRLWRD